MAANSKRFVPLSAGLNQEASSQLISLVFARDIKDLRGFFFFCLAVMSVFCGYASNAAGGRILADLQD